MSGFTPINQGCSHQPKDALYERPNNRLRHIINSDEQIAMLNGSGYSGTSHPEDDDDHSADTRVSQDRDDGHQVASQANDNETTTVAKTLAILHSHTDTIDRLHATLSNLQDEIKAQRDDYYDIHRNLPPYDLGPVIRPQLLPSRGGNSIFNGRSSPPFGTPKPTAPCTPLRVLPTHPLTETGVISDYDCQHMYQAGLSGKHDELKDVYLAVSNAPGNQSHAFYGDKLRPIQQQSPGELQGLVDVHNKMLGMTDRLWQAEPGTSLQGPTEKWAKETIGAFPPAIENGARNRRVYENTERFATASAAAVKALGAEKGYGGTNCSVEAIIGHQKALYGNSEDWSGHGGQANNGDHRGLRDGLYVIGNGYRGQANVDHPGVNGGSHSTASLLLRLRTFTTTMMPQAMITKPSFPDASPLLGQAQ